MSAVIAISLTLATIYGCVNMITRNLLTYLGGAIRVECKTLLLNKCLMCVINAQTTKDILRSALDGTSLGGTGGFDSSTPHCRVAHVWELLWEAARYHDSISTVLELMYYLMHRMTICIVPKINGHPLRFEMTIIPDAENPLIHNAAPIRTCTM